MRLVITLKHVACLFRFLQEQVKATKEDAAIETLALNESGTAPACPTTDTDHARSNAEDELWIGPMKKVSAAAAELQVCAK